MTLPPDVRMIGVNDHDIDLFESLYPVPNGMSYNSYVILDEKVAVMDPVDQHCTAPWLHNLRSALDGRTPDYLIVHHMEPDHSANIVTFMDAYPQAAVVASRKAFAMMQAFFGHDYGKRRIVIRDGDQLSLGKHRLLFLAAPMVHWPEVMMTYDAATQTLFSADAFGCFGALDRSFSWLEEARRYYFGIVGKFGAAVQQVLDKLRDYPLRCICPLHGPVLTDPLAEPLRLYGLWSSYAPESRGVTIACASVYGHTMDIARQLAEKLRSQGMPVSLYDLARCDMSTALADSFRFDHLVLASTTYNGDMFPAMQTFLQQLVSRGYRDRRVCLIENGSWAPNAAQQMRRFLQPCPDIAFPCEPLRILSSAKMDTQLHLDALASAIAAQ